MADTILIKRFIYHVMKRTDQGFTVEHLKPRTLEGEVQVFFQNLFASQMDGARFVYRKDSTHSTRDQLNALLDEEEEFVAHSRDLVDRFAEQHRAQASDGVFIIATGSLNANPAVFLMKYDQIEAVELLVGGTTYTDKALTLDKRNVMKFAVHDQEATHRWDVLAHDRQTSGEKVIADYFREFLGVDDLMDSTRSTQTLLLVARNWASATSLLPNAATRIDVQAAALTYAQTKPTYSAESFLEHLIPKDSTALKDARAELEKTLWDKNLGNDFDLNGAAVKSAIARQTLVTKEGVKVIMSKGFKSSRVKITKMDDGERITISTKEITVRPS